MKHLLNVNLYYRGFAILYPILAIKLRVLVIRYISFQWRPFLALTLVLELALFRHGTQLAVMKVTTHNKAEMINVQKLAGKTFLFENVSFIVLYTAI